MQDIGAVNDFQRFAHIMVGDQHTNAAILQMLDQITNFANRDRVNPGQRFIKQDIGRVGRQRAGNFAAPTFTARKCQRGGAAQMCNAEFSQQFIQHFFAPVAFRLRGYGLSLDARCDEYAARLLALPAMQAWDAAALQEPWREAAHEREVAAVAASIVDLRTRL